MPGEAGAALDAEERSNCSQAMTVKVAAVGLSDRRAPAGGIIPARSFLTTFSHVSAFSPTCATSNLSNISPAVLVLSLWQPKQY